MYWDDYFWVAFDRFCSEHNLFIFGCVICRKWPRPKTKPTSQVILVQIGNKKKKSISFDKFSDICLLKPHCDCLVLENKRGFGSRSKHIEKHSKKCLASTGLPGAWKRPVTCTASLTCWTRLATSIGSGSSANFIPSSASTSTATGAGSPPTDAAFPYTIPYRSWLQFNTIAHTCKFLKTFNQ